MSRDTSPIMIQLPSTPVPAQLDDMIDPLSHNTISSHHINLEKSNSRKRRSSGVSSVAAAGNDFSMKPKKFKARKHAVVEEDEDTTYTLSAKNSSRKHVKGAWCESEDQLLKELVEKAQGAKKVSWSVIAQSLPGRIGKQCRERWYNHLDPSVKKEPWTPEEDKIIIESHGTYGNQWAVIAKLLPGRPANAIKNHWNSTLRRQTDRTGPSSEKPLKVKRESIGRKRRRIEYSSASSSSEDDDMTDEPYCPSPLPQSVSLETKEVQDHQLVQEPHFFVKYSSNLNVQQEEEEEEDDDDEEDTTMQQDLDDFDFDLSPRKKQKPDDISPFQSPPSACIMSSSIELLAPRVQTIEVDTRYQGRTWTPFQRPPLPQAPRLKEKLSEQERQKLRQACLEKLIQNDDVRVWSHVLQQLELASDDSSRSAQSDVLYLDFEETALDPHAICAQAHSVRH